MSIVKIQCLIAAVIITGVLYFQNVERKVLAIHAGSWTLFGLTIQETKPPKKPKK